MSYPLDDAEGTLEPGDGSGKPRGLATDRPDGSER